MRLAEGFVVGGRYRIERLLAAGSKFRVYEATGGALGPGQVCVKVARHDDVSSLQELEEGRRHVAREWQTLVRLHERGSSAAPMPLELVRMYPGAAAIREIALEDKQAVRSEPYLVCELSDGVTVASLLRDGALDDERALLIALRVVLFVRGARAAGVDFTDFSPTNFVVDHAGENLSVVGVSAPDVLPASAPIDADAMPVGFGRLLASLLGGAPAPPWTGSADELPRWQRFLASRRIPKVYHDLVLGALGYEERFPRDIEAIENRLRAFAGAPRVSVHDHPARARDTPYLIAPGERIADRFEVLGPLGQGGRGYVYRAVDALSGAEVLFKCNKYLYDAGSAFALELPTRRMELEHEFEILKRFSTATGMLPQPVALAHDVGRGAWFDLAPDLARGEPYLVMEHVKGVPLVDLLPQPLAGYSGASIRGNRLDARFVIRLVAQLADLLTRFHDAGFLYQDLKPENVLFDPDGENVFLVDFAAACPRNPDGLLDRKHVAFGVQTHGFAAPEFADRWERSDDRFDIYSLGASAYHLLTGVNPERVALEEGKEYPTLALRLLDGVPRPVADLVRRCLAPVDQRIPTAAEVKRLAELARLQLSNTKPLDVLEPWVEYTESGVALSWALPPDPRIDGVRVTRETGGVREVVYEGKVTSRMVDPTPIEEDRTYRVDTSYTRAGARRRSRGRAVEASATPPVVRFDVTPYFGGVRLRVESAPHADETIARWSEAEPPVEPLDGHALPLSDGERTFQPLQPGVTVHYAAFARYGEIVSSPRFATATPLEPVASVSRFEATQSAGGVTLSWDGDDSRLVVLAATGSGPPRRIRPVPGTREVEDTRPLPGEQVLYQLVAEESGVRSDPMAERAVRRWPDLPVITLTPGAGCVSIAAESAFDVSIVDVEIAVVPVGEAPEAWSPVDDFPATVEAPSDRPVVVALRTLLEDGEVGPGLAGELVVPPPDVALDIDAGDGLIPLSLRVSLPASAAAWSGEYELRLHAGDEELVSRTGSIPELFEIEDDACVLLTAGPDADAGDSLELAARLFAPDGEVVGERVAVVRVRERLAPPECEARLGAVTVLVIPGVGRVDLQATTGGATETLRRVELPRTVEAVEGEEVSVCVRRSVEGEPMPWSESAVTRALARPPAPVAGRVEEAEDGLVVRWDTSVTDGVTYEVRDADGELVYLGAAAEYSPPGGLAPAYTVVTRRDGIASVPLRVVPDTRLVADRVRVLDTVIVRRPSGAAAPLRGRAGGADALVRVARCRGVDVAELRCGPEPRLVAVYDPRVLSAWPPPAEAGRGDWMAAPGVVAVHVVLGGRALVPWPRARLGRGAALGLAIAEVGVDPPRWFGLGGPVSVDDGTIVGAVGVEDGVALRAFGGSVSVGEEDVLEVSTSTGRVLRVPIGVAAAGELGSEPHIVSLGDAADDAAGLGLDTSSSPSILVPATGLTRRAVQTSVWADVSRGFALLLAQRLESRWKAPMASRYLGATSVFHFVHDAGHVEVAVGVEVLGGDGRARLDVEVASRVGRSLWRRRFALSRPEKYDALLDRAVRWIARQHDLDTGPPDPIALLG